jgi:transposase
MLDVMDKTPNQRLLAPERAAPQRSGGEANGGTNNAAAYKARIVEEAQRCTEPGEIGALLRREGLYSSALTQWRRQYQAGALKGLQDDKRGRKRTQDPRDQELQRLKRDNERLNKKLRQAELIIEIQKKVAAMLGNPIETLPDREEIS